MSRCLQPRLRVSSTGQKKPAYRCNAREALPQTTGHVSRQAEALDSYVEQVIIERLSRPDAALLLVPPRTGGPDTTALRLETVEIRQRLDQLADAHADGAVTLSQLTRGTERMRARLADLEAQLAAAVTTDPLVGVPNPGEVWAGLDIVRRRAVMDLLITVTVLPWTGKRGPGGSRFDPNGVRIEWKRS